MTGTLRTKTLKNGEYYYLRLNTYNEAGERKPKWIATGLPVKGNKKKAEQLLREAIREYEQREAAFKGSGDMRFSDWTRYWLGEAEKRVDPITHQGYAVIVRNHILPYFDEKGTRLVDVDRPLLQAYVDQKAEHGRVDGKGGLAPKSIRHLRNVLHLALKHAMESGLIQGNPSEGLRLPKRQRYEYTFYNQQQLEEMFEAFRDESLYPLIRLAAVYGLRRSELLGLQWDSIDFAANTLTVKHTVVKMEEIVRKDCTKSQASYRTFGYLLRWQRDVGGRYGEKEIYCVAGGRVYYCSTCRYRDERSNFCGFCMKKLLDDAAEKKRGARP